MNDFMTILETKLKELGAYVFQHGDLKRGLLAANGVLQCRLMFTGVDLALNAVRPIATVTVYVPNTVSEEDFMNNCLDIINGLNKVAVIQTFTRVNQNNEYHSGMITVRND